MGLLLTKGQRQQGSMRHPPGTGRGEDLPCFTVPELELHGQGIQGFAQPSPSGLQPVTIQPQPPGVGPYSCNKSESGPCACLGLPGSSESLRPA